MSERGNEREIKVGRSARGKTETNGRRQKDRRKA